jgi:hypothetical protein
MLPACQFAQINSTNAHAHVIVSHGPFSYSGIRPTFKFFTLSVVNINPEMPVSFPHRFVGNRYINGVLYLSLLAPISLFTPYDLS